MAEWKKNEDGTWNYGDDLQIRAGKGPGQKDIYHCYRDGKYVAQADSLDKAKAACKASKKG